MKPSNDYHYLGRELYRRSREPLNHLPFVVFAFIGIVAFGPLGVWVEVYKVMFGFSADWSSIITGVIAFYPAFVASTAVQLIFEANDASDKVFAAFAILILTILLISAVALLPLSAAHPTAVLILGVCFSGLSGWLWWITNGVNPTFRAKERTDAAVGGDTSRPVIGTLSGIAS